MEDLRKAELDKAIESAKLRAEAQIRQIIQQQQDDDDASTFNDGQSQ